MKKSILLLICVVSVIAGCGKKDEAKFQGVSERRDYVAEGMKYLSTSDVPRAIKSFDEAIRQDPTNSDNYIILGQVYMRLNNFSRAVDTFNAATKVDSNNGEIYYLLAVNYGISGDKDNAIKAAQHSAELFRAQQDEDKFKRALILLKSLMESQEGAQAKS